ALGWPWADPTTRSPSPAAQAVSVVRAAASRGRAAPAGPVARRRSTSTSLAGRRPPEAPAAEAVTAWLPAPTAATAALGAMRSPAPVWTQGGRESPEPATAATGAMAPMARQARTAPPAVRVAPAAVADS